MTQMVAPDLPVIQLITGARVLVAVRGAAGGTDAARLLGAYDVLRMTEHVPTLIIRHDRARAEKALRAMLGDAAFERAHAEGGGLSFEEAAALI
jgi:hypothetical protein